MNGTFEPPADWRRITTIDAHTAGEPLRVITGGYPRSRARRSSRSAASRASATTTCGAR